MTGNGAKNGLKIKVCFGGMVDKFISSEVKSGFVDH